MPRLKLALLLFVKEPFSPLGISPNEEMIRFALLFKQFLEATNSRVSLFLPGRLIEVLLKYSPQEAAWMRERVRDGHLEMMGGGFYDAMLPLFPTQLQEIQLQKYRDLVSKNFSVEPSGYFNSSMAWEIGMTETLAKKGYEYTLVGEESLQEALGRSTRVSGWYTTEDCGSVMRLLSVATDLSEAISQGGATACAKFDSLPETEKHWVAAVSVPISNPELLSHFFTDLTEIILKQEIQSWTISHIFEQQFSEGKINLMSAVGSNVGLPTASHSCRELLIRRPEADFLHKSLLAAYRHAEATLQGSVLEDIQNILLPVMAPEYYSDLPGNEGVQSPGVRWKGNREVIEAEKKIVRQTGLTGQSIEVADYLMEGHRQILVNNSQMAFLLEQQRGGALRSLIYKPSSLNLVNALRQDGDISFAFLDHLLDPSLNDVGSFESALNDHAGQLKSPYDYQINRLEAQVDVLLRSEQVATIAENKHVFHVDKVFSVKWGKPFLDLSYTLVNTTFSEVNGYFGTELDLGMRMFDKKTSAIKINGAKISIDFTTSTLYSNVKSFVLKDGLLSYAICFDLPREAHVMVSPVLSTLRSAAPNLVQGIRLFFFWNMELKPQGTEAFNLRMKLSKRGIFL